MLRSLKRESESLEGALEKKSLSAVFTRDSVGLRARWVAHGEVVRADDDGIHPLILGGRDPVLGGVVVSSQRGWGVVDVTHWGVVFRGVDGRFAVGDVKLSRLRRRGVDGWANIVLD